MLALIRFLSELLLLGLLAAVGAWLGGNVAFSIILAVLLPVAAATVWGRFIGPKAARRLADPQRLSVELGLFGVTVLALILLGHWVLGLVLGLSCLAGTWHGRAGG